jgi:chorismate dehydratase
MWDFEHSPHNVEMAERYDVHLTTPAQCAEELLTSRADLGLIPIASLTESLSIVPGCTIASLRQVRSIQLIVKLRGNSGSDTDEVLKRIRSISTDTASRSSVAYAKILFRRFVGTDPEFMARDADPAAMLAKADAALLIGDPALLALEMQAAVEQVAGPCLWIDLAEQWIARTRLPWVAAVWAVRPEALGPLSVTAATLSKELQRSRDSGLANVERLVEEWSNQIPLPAATIRAYLMQNIHYTLTPECIESIRLFHAYAAELGVLPETTLRFL